MSGKMMAALKDRLSRLREKFDLTQEQVAELTGISQRQISRYESGGDITGDNLLKLSQVFGVSTDFLLGKTDGEDSEFAPKERSVISAWRRGERIKAIKEIVDDE